MQFTTSSVFGLAALLTTALAQSSAVSLPTNTDTASLSSLVFTTDGVTGSMTATYLSSLSSFSGTLSTHVPVPSSLVSSTASGTSVVLSGTASSTTALGTTTRGIVTPTTSASGTASASTAAASGSSNNAHARVLGSGELGLGAAGLLAGLVVAVV